MDANFNGTTQPQPSPQINVIQHDTEYEFTQSAVHGGDVLPNCWPNNTAAITTQYSHAVVAQPNSVCINATSQSTPLSQHGYLQPSLTVTSTVSQPLAPHAVADTSVYKHITHVPETISTVTDYTSIAQNTSLTFAEAYNNFHKSLVCTSPQIVSATTVQDSQSTTTVPRIQGSHTEHTEQTVPCKKPRNQESNEIESDWAVLRNRAPEDYLNPIRSKEPTVDETADLDTSDTSDEPTVDVNVQHQTSHETETNDVSDNKSQTTKAYAKNGNVNKQHTDRIDSLPNVSIVANTETVVKETSVEVDSDECLVRRVEPQFAIRRGSRKRKTPHKIDISSRDKDKRKSAKPLIRESLTPSPIQRSVRNSTRTNPTQDKRKGKPDTHEHYRKSLKADTQQKDVNEKRSKRRKIIDKGDVAVKRKEESPIKETKELSEHIQKHDLEIQNEILQYCDTCIRRADHGKDACPFLNPVTVIPNDCYNKLLYNMPTCITMGRSLVRPVKYGLFARDEIRAYTQFGPLKGDVYEPEDLNVRDVEVTHLWTIDWKNYIFPKRYLYTKDNATSNYLKFIQPHTIGSEPEYNVQQMVKSGEIYFITTKVIVPGDELIMRCMEFPFQLYREIESRCDLELMEWKTGCTPCNKQLGSLLYKIRHRLLLHNPNPGMYAFGPLYMCWRCLFEFKTVNEYVAHLRESHPEQPIYCCILCETSLQTVTEYEQHIGKHVGRETPCDECDEVFASRAHMRSHSARIHTQNQHLLCEICRVTFTSTKRLLAHIRRVHEKDQLAHNQCDQCGKIFSDAHNLRVHYLTHTGLKPFECPQKDCEFAFTTKQCIKHHLRKVHNLPDDQIPDINPSFYYSIENQLTQGASVAKTDGDGYVHGTGHPPDMAMDHEAKHALVQATEGGVTYM